MTTITYLWNHIIDHCVLQLLEMNVFIRGVMTAQILQDIGCTLSILAVLVYNYFSEAINSAAILCSQDRGTILTYIRLVRCPC